jgi:ribosome maturation factor RimP
MDRPIWTSWPLGERVTIRRTLPEGGYSDWVGVLEEAAPTHVTVRHRSGAVRRIEKAEIAIAHLIQPKPPRALSRDVT